MLFVVASPVRNKLLWVFMLLTEAYLILNIVLVPNYEIDFTHLFWPGLVITLGGIVFEVLLSRRLYKKEYGNDDKDSASIKVYPISEDNKLDITKQPFN